MGRNIQIDGKLLWRGVRVTVKDLPLGDTVVVLVEETGELVQVSIVELTPRPSEREAPLAAPLMQISTERWSRAAERAAVARAILAVEQGRNLEVAKYAEKLGVSERTIWRTLDVYRSIGTTSALIPRPPGRKKGARVLDADVEVIVADCIDKHYLRREKPTLKHLHDHVAVACRAQGLDPVSRGALKVRVAAYGKLRVARKRLGSKRARELHAPAPGHCTADRPLELVQIDHTPADVILVSDDEFREVIGRPWLTIAIDIATRMVLGFHVSFDPPSSVAVALCLSHAMSPKEEWLKELGVDGEWPCSGTMEILAMDNAQEFHAKALERGCEEHGIEIRYRPVGRPHYGGHVERLVGTMMGFCHLLPGTTQSNVKAKGDYDAERHAVMTLSEFRAWLALQIVSNYHLRAHRTLDVPPLVAWKKATASNAAPKSIAPKNALELTVTFLPAETRVVHRTGIEMFCRHYWAPELADLLDHGKSTLVYYDPRDIGHVYFRSANGVLVEAMATEKDTPRISINEWNRRRQRNRTVSNAPAFVAKRDAGLVANEDRVGQAVAKTKAARRYQSRLQRSDPTNARGSRPTHNTPEADITGIDFTRTLQTFEVLQEKD
jgi:putative transposase